MPQFNGVARIIGFNTQPPEGGWDRLLMKSECCMRFQHTAARRRLDEVCCIRVDFSRFQHTAARRRLETDDHANEGNSGFNTQPPEGGWELKS